MSLSSTCMGRQTPSLHKRWGFENCWKSPHQIFNLQTKWFANFCKGLQTTWIQDVGLKIAGKENHSMLNLQCSHQMVCKPLQRFANWPANNQTSQIVPWKPSVRSMFESLNDLFLLGLFEHRAKRTSSLFRSVGISRDFTTCYAVALVVTIE